MVMGYEISAQWKEGHVPVIAAFMREPRIYWAINDHLAMQPESWNIEEYIKHPDVQTYVAAHNDMMIGYVQFVRRTSMCGEMTVAFAPHWRGGIAREMTRYAMAEMFRTGSLLKIFASVPTDNKPAIFAARHIGMKQEGRLTKAIVRADGLRDLLIFGVTRDEFLRSKRQ